VPPAAEAVMVAALALLIALAAWDTRRGKCPTCGARVRFRPRIELPLACANCAAQFWPAVPQDSHPDA
jgi:hypothetical protein